MVRVTRLRTSVLGQCLNKLVLASIIELCLVAPLLLYILYHIIVMKCVRRTAIHNGNVPPILGAFLVISHLPSVLLLSWNKVKWIGFVGMFTLNVLGIYLILILWG